MDVRLLDGGVLGFTLSGPMTLHALQAAGQEIAKTCLERGVPRALADGRPMSGDLSVLEWHELAAGFETNWPLGLRLAVVDHADRVKPDRVMETTARNRGIDVRVFIDDVPALAWLRAWKPESA